MANVSDDAIVRKLWWSIRYFIVLIVIWLSWIPVSRVGQGNFSFIVIPLVAVSIAAFYFAHKLQSLPLSLSVLTVYYVAAIYVLLSPLICPSAVKELRSMPLLCLPHVTLQVGAWLVSRRYS